MVEEIGSSARATHPVPKGDQVLARNLRGPLADKNRPPWDGPMLFTGPLDMTFMKLMLLIPMVSPRSLRLHQTLCGSALRSRGPSTHSISQRRLPRSNRSLMNWRDIRWRKFWTIIPTRILHSFSLNGKGGTGATLLGFLLQISFR